MSQVPEYILRQGDCLEVMPRLSAGLVDLVLCDLPYGTTQNRWDAVIPFASLWGAYRRVAKDSAAIVLFAGQPFTSTLIGSNIDEFKYAWVWNKVNKFSGHLNAKKQPLRIVEDICVFYREQPTYCPQMVPGIPYKATSKGRKSSNFGAQADGVTTVNTGLYYPKNLLSVPGDERGTAGRLHPTQKPIAVLEYLIKTYTNPGDVVLDNTMGSGSTGVAALNTGRRFIGIEKDPQYFEIAKARIEQRARELASREALTEEAKCG